MSTFELPQFQTFLLGNLPLEIQGKNFLLPLKVIYGFYRLVYLEQKIKNYECIDSKQLITLL